MGDDVARGSREEAAGREGGGGGKRRLALQVFLRTSRACVPGGGERGWESWGGTSAGAGEGLVGRGMMNEQDGQACESHDRSRGVHTSAYLTDVGMCIWHVRYL